MSWGANTAWPRLSLASGQKRCRFTMAFLSKTPKKRRTWLKSLSYGSRKTNIIYERYLFNNRNQQEGETVETYASTLRSLQADTCNFGVLKDELIKDRIVCGVRDNGMRKKLLQVPELTCDKCVDICRSAEATSTQLEAMTGQSSHSPPPSVVNKVSKTPKQPGKPPVLRECRYCGQSHEKARAKCPAFGKVCNNCKKENHFASKCAAGKQPRQKKSGGRKSRRKSVFQSVCAGRK